MENNTGGVMEFFYQADEKSPAVSVRISPHSNLTDVLESFEGFLKCAGYSFEGEVDIISYKMVPQDPNAEAN